MTEITGTRENQLRIAAAQAARTPVDNNGNPTGEPTTYTYDERGLLLDAKTAPATEGTTHE